MNIMPRKLFIDHFQMIYLADVCAVLDLDFALEVLFLLSEEYGFSPFAIAPKSARY